MLLAVRVSDWELEESGRVLSVGDEDRFWLTFEEADRWTPRPEMVNVSSLPALLKPAPHTR